MVFCGHCGYQLAPGDKICPRCGAETDIDSPIQEPGASNPTEMSQVMHDLPPYSSPARDGNQPPHRPMPPQQAGPLVLRPSSSANYGNEEDATTMMNAPAPTYQQSQQFYPGPPAQTSMGGYGYNAPSQFQYQGDQSAVVAQLLASSRKGKIGALLLILFGLLLLIAAIIIFLLNQQGIIFSG